MARISLLPKQEFVQSAHAYVPKFIGNDAGTGKKLHAPVDVKSSRPFPIVKYLWIPQRAHDAVTTSY